MLSKRGVPASAAGEDGTSPLHIAARMGDQTIAATRKNVKKSPEESIKIGFGRCGISLQQFFRDFRDKGQVQLAVSVSQAAATRRF